MGIGKWIGGIIGFMALGPLGALAGIVFGSLFDEGINQAGQAYGGPAKQLPFLHARDGIVHHQSRRADHAQ